MKCCRWTRSQILCPKSVKISQNRQIVNCEQIIWLENLKLQIMLKYLVIYLIYAIWGVSDTPFFNFWILWMWRYTKMAKIKVTEWLKSWYHHLWADYLIINPKYQNNAGIHGYLILICNLRCCRWPISPILGPEGV